MGNRRGVADGHRKRVAGRRGTQSSGCVYHGARGVADRRVGAALQRVEMAHRGVGPWIREYMGGWAPKRWKRVEWRRQNRAKQAHERQHGGVPLTFLTVNGKKMSYQAAKATGLEERLAKHAWPSLVLVTEFNGVPGKLDVADYFGPEVRRRYKNILYSLRSHKIDGMHAADGVTGGGIVLLVHKRLCASVTEFSLAPFVDADEKVWLDGHARVWRLDPKVERPGGRPPPRYLPCPVMVFCAYIPPRGQDWGKTPREVIIRSLTAAAMAVKELRRVQDVFPIMLAHTNLPDVGCPLDLVLDKGMATLEAEMAAMPQLDLVRGSLQLGAVCPKLKRQTSDVVGPKDTQHNRPAIKQGIEFAEAMAAAGMVALAGVTGLRLPTSWKPDALHPLRGPMHSVHDNVYVPAEIVWQYFQSPTGGRDVLRYSVRREKWSMQLDHAVTAGCCLLRPLRPPAADKKSTTGPLRLRKKGWKEDTDLLYRWKSGKEQARPWLNRYTSLYVEEEGGLASLDDEKLNVVMGRALTQTGADLMAADKVEFARRRAAKAATAPEISVRQAFLAKERAHTAKMTAMRAVAAEATRHWGRLPYHLPHRLASVRAQELVAQRQRLDRVHKAAVIAHRKAVKAAHNRLASQRLAKDPGGQWGDWAKIVDDGGLLKLKVSPLLEELHDKHGKLISKDTSVILELLEKKRSQVFAWREMYSVDCEDGVNRALVELQEFNAAMVAAQSVGQTFSAESIVTLQAQDPMAPVRASDTRRNYARDLSNRIAARRMTRFPASQRGDAIRQRFPHEVMLLEREPELVELSGVVSRLKGNKGTGTDPNAAALLKYLESGDFALDVLLEQTVRVWRHGVIPTDWKELRCLLHHKKGDPYCAENYRGLCIGQLQLKVLSLLMMARLERFLLKTQCLSLAQGGFQRRRGCPEQVFTLTESVKAASEQGPVHIVYVDIECAYDSVLHPLLWERCIACGIGGRFLTTLQAIHYNVEAVLDVDGVLSKKFKVECGVLQGNPLSPLLFNIYIDGALRALHEHGAGRPNGRVGIPLPRVCGRGPGGHRVSPLAHALPRANGYMSQDDYLSSLFFADDGALPDLDQERLQDSLTVMEREFDLLGMKVNVPKTKWMMVMPHSCSNRRFELLVAAAKASAWAPRIYGQLIELVPEFDYLGMRVNSRWNWDAAWQDQQRNAWAAYHGYVAAGFQNRVGSVAMQLLFVQNKMFSYLVYIAATTGAGGKPTTAPWAKNKVVVETALRAIMGGKHNGAALRMETGIWDPEVIIMNLQLRMACKFHCAPVDSLYYRAMCLSNRRLEQSPEQLLQPASKWDSRSQAYKQMWAQIALATGLKLGIPQQAMRDMAHFGLVTLEGRRPGGGFVPLLHPHKATAMQHAATDALFNGGHFRVVISARRRGEAINVGENAWSLPEMTVYSSALDDWSEPLEQACFAALRRRCNAYRQTLARAIHQEQVDDGRALRRFAQWSPASFRQPYLYLDNVQAVRLLMRLRMDLRGEDAERRQPHEATHNMRALDRIDNPAHRPCYVCWHFFGVWARETGAHVSLFCRHPAMIVARAAIRAHLAILALDPEVLLVAPAAPDFHDDSVLWTILMLCMSLGPTPVLHQVAALEGVGGFALNVARARGAAAWLQALSEPWVASFRDPRRRRTPQAYAGGRVFAYVAEQVQRLWQLRRQLLRTVPAYRTRALDPRRGGPAVARAQVGYKGLTYRMMMAMFFFLICVVVICFIAFVLKIFSIEGVS